MSKQELHPRTAVLNKSQKNHSKKLKTQALHWLAKHFPLAFDNTLRIRPLKTGIMSDILLHTDKAAMDGISKGKLREAVVIFTRRLDYLACLKAREMRVDLYGNEVAEVTIEEAEHAAAKIKKKIEKSVKNARKLMSQKAPQIATQQTAYSKSASSFSSGNEEVFPVYPARGLPSNMGAAPMKASAVIVKHKTTKQYDPDAVARLKEKLGLSLTQDKQKEMAE
ncbi:MAG: activator of prop osmoprotectant transporter [Legionella sp.]|nr:MAG: activator of prop osmoprotectant transporter [Legionella sp.]PJE00190.1 MAG: activator of prop osmoprotectant transporter [Legionella sp.]